MKTKAVRIHGKMDLRLEEIELPQVGPDDVQVKIISDSICMSTYKAAVEGEEHKRVPNDVAEHPTIVGHEFCGVITEVGENWKNKYKPGQGFAIQPAHFYKGSQMAPGYSYQYTGIPRQLTSPYSTLPPFFRKIYYCSRIVPSNGICRGFAFKYGKFLLPPCFLTALSVPKVPTRKQ